mmetsp:Transcript_87778/g.200610  ORF Transcript_87778/g.200610 Transcript_87778/m.200610 type:complete len:324 (-) Transcript_87778:36-1007(-)
MGLVALHGLVSLPRQVPLHPSVDRVEMVGLRCIGRNPTCATLLVHRCIKTVSLPLGYPDMLLKVSAVRPPLRFKPLGGSCPHILSCPDGLALFAPHLHRCMLCLKNTPPHPRLHCPPLGPPRLVPRPTPSAQARHVPPSEPPTDQRSHPGRSYPPPPPPAGDPLRHPGTVPHRDQLRPRGPGPPRRAGAYAGAPLTQPLPAPAPAQSPSPLSAGQGQEKTDHPLAIHVSKMLPPPLQFSSMAQPLSGSALDRHCCAEHHTSPSLLLLAAILPPATLDGSSGTLSDPPAHPYPLLHRAHAEEVPVLLLPVHHTLILAAVWTWRR